MPPRPRPALLCMALLSLLGLGSALVVSAQDRAADIVEQTRQDHLSMPNRMTETQRQADQVRKTAAPAPTLTARLLQPEPKAKKHEAGVQVQVTGVEIVDPAAVNEKSAPGQGHLHYQLDNGPVIATTATKLNFHQLAPGKHQITVTLAGNDHNPLGPKETLHVTIPGR